MSNEGNNINSSHVIIIFLSSIQGAWIPSPNSIPRGEVKPKWNRGTTEGQDCSRKYIW